MANSWQENEDDTAYEEFTLKEPSFRRSPETPPSMAKQISGFLMILGMSVALFALAELTSRGISKWLD